MPKSDQEDEFAMSLIGETAAAPAGDLIKDATDASFMADVVEASKGAPEAKSVEQQQQRKRATRRRSSRRTLCHSSASSSSSWPAACCCCATDILVLVLWLLVLKAERA